MTTRVITISTADIAALRAIRPVVADAAGHPGRDAAIQAIDRMGKAESGCAEYARRKQADDAFIARLGAVGYEPDPARVIGDLLAQHFGPGTPVGDAEAREAMALPALPADWYDGKPKRCLGVGRQPRVAYCGIMTSDGERTYRSLCNWCHAPFEPGEPMPEHTFTPVRPEDLRVEQGKLVQAFENAPTPPPGSWRDMLPPGSWSDAPPGLAVALAEREYSAANPIIRYRCPGCDGTADVQDVAIAPPDCERCKVRMYFVTRLTSYAPVATYTIGEVRKAEAHGLKTIVVPKAPAATPVGRLTDRAPPGAVTGMTAALAGVFHVGGQCCQERRCEACGAPRHEQGRHAPARGFEPPMLVDVDVACECCDAHRFR